MVSRAGVSEPESPARGGQLAASQISSTRRAPESEIEIIGEAAPLIPEGTYDAVGGKASVLNVFGSRKLAVQFDLAIPDSESPNGIRHVSLMRYYNVKPGPGGRHGAGPHSVYFRDWTLVAGRRPSRRDRLSPSVFTGALVSVEVRTVSKDSRQHPLPEHARYSVIARLVEAKTRGGQ